MTRTWYDRLLRLRMLTPRAHSTTLELRSESSAGQSPRGRSEAGRAPLRGESSPGARKGALRAHASRGAARRPSSRTSRRCRTLVALAPPDMTAGASRTSFTSRSHWRSYGGFLGAASQKASMSSRGSSCPLSSLPEESVARRRRDPSDGIIAMGPDRPPGAICALPAPAEDPHHWHGRVRRRFCSP